MTSIPPTNPAIAKWWCPYSSADGKSSSIDMYTMIPATAASTMAEIDGFQKCINTSIASSAPAGSASPDRIDHFSAFPRLPVEW